MEHPIVVVITLKNTKYIILHTKKKTKNNYNTQNLTLIKILPLELLKHIVK